MPAWMRHLSWSQAYSSHMCLFAFCCGVFITLCLTELIPLIWLCGFALVVMLGTVLFRALIGVLFFILGLGWATLQFNSYLNEPFGAEFVGVDLVLEGTIIDLPSDNNGDLRFRLRVDESAIVSLVNRRIQLSCYRCSLDVVAGQKWSFTVRLKRPHGYASPGAFDYEKYLFRHRIVARGYVRTQGVNELFGLNGQYTNRWREAIRDNLKELDDGVGRNMIAALTIGDKSGFSQQQKKVFQETGVSHLMAISGLHVGLVFLSVSYLLRWLLWPFARLFDRIPRQHLVLLPAMIAAVIYAALAGFAVSTQRALIMLTVFVFCRMWARKVCLFEVLLISVALLLLYDPFSVLDIGFWLSAGAVFVIALFGAQQHADEGSVDEQARSDKPAVGNQSLLRLQPRLWLGMLPMTSLFFGQVSMISPMVNLLMVPLFCSVLIPITLTAVLLLNCGLPSLGLAILEQLVALFEFLYAGLQWCISWQHARLFTTPFIFWQWLLVIVIVVVELLRLKQRVWLWLVLVGSLFIDTSPALDDSEIRIALLDVGQGLAMVIQTANTVTVYDTGPRYSSGFSAAQAVVLPYLRQHGIKTIDRLIISHADNDHIGGLQVLLEHMQVEEILTSRVDKIPTAQNCTAGQSWFDDDTTFMVISPEARTPNGSNNRSCVIRIEHHGTRVLISGDIEKQVERYLVNKHVGRNDVLSADILLVPHQGSKTSSTQDFLQAVRPKLALVAAGYRNHYGHPNSAVARRYAENDIELLSTIDSGTIELTIDQNGWRTSSFRISEQRFWHYQKVSNH